MIEQIVLTVMLTLFVWLVRVQRAGRRMGRELEGWSRVASAKPCDFCAMLASRGAVYSATSGALRAHDHCECGLEPAF